MPRLSNKTALVTGSTKGIGFNIAQLLSAYGCNVMVNSRHDEEVKKVAQSLPGAKGFAADVTIPKDAKRLVEYTLSEFKEIDFLVCNVGSGSSVAPGDETPEEWSRVFNVNFFSSTNVIEAAKPSLELTSGNVVCVSSICGVEVIPGAPVTYSVAKAALNAYVRGIARPLGQLGIRINAIAAGNILFPGSVWERKLIEDESGVQNSLEREVALNRLGDPNDVAELVVYLLSSQSRFVTGAVWNLDGGQVRH